MSNHGIDNEALPEFPGHLLAGKDHPFVKAARQLLFTDRDQLGATGRFPLGKLTPEDEGELRFAIAAAPQTKTVILDFGKPVAWLGLPRADALALADMLKKKAEEL
jgi:hypothetical protein